MAKGGTTAAAPSIRLSCHEKLLQGHYQALTGCLGWQLWPWGFPTPDNVLRRVVSAAEFWNHSQARLTAAGSPFCHQEHNLIQRRSLGIFIFPTSIFKCAPGENPCFYFSDACAFISSGCYSFIPSSLLFSKRNVLTFTERNYCFCTLEMWTCHCSNYLLNLTKQD